MIDAKLQLLDMLKDIRVRDTNDSPIPIVYEFFVDDKTPLPCISYMQSGDMSDYEGDTVRYSTVSFLIKIYSKSMLEVEKISKEVDKILSKNFKRNGGNEFLLGEIIVRNFNYISNSIYEIRS